MARRPLVVSMVGMLLAVAACGGSESDVASPSTAAPTPTVTPTTQASAQDTELVESIVDDFNAALVETDPQAAAGLFADDGVFVDKHGTPQEGPAGISKYVEQMGPGITRCERTGAVAVVGTGAYVFPVEFTYHGVDYERAVALTVDNDLITLHEWQAGT